MVRLVHPFPSLLNAGLVFVLALTAGARPALAGLLALGMLGLQFAIGAYNDFCDVELDRLTKPAKPIPADLVGRREAAIVAAACAVAGLAAAATVGPLVMVLAGAMLGFGLAYDAWLKIRGLGWVAFALAFPLLPVYAWYGAAGELPPRPEVLLPVAALAGPMLQLANGLTDLERDARGGVVGLAGRLGRRRAVGLLAVLQLAVNGLAWLTALAGGPVSDIAIGALAAAALASGGGMVLSASPNVAARQWGWHAQAVGLALLAAAWLALAANA